MLNISLLCILNMKAGFYQKIQVHNISYYLHLFSIEYVETVTVMQGSLATVNEVKMDCGGDIKTVRIFSSAQHEILIFSVGACARTKL